MLKKFRKLIFREKYVFTAFGITAAVLLIFAMAAKLAPFGPNSLLAMDLYGQYYPMMAEKLSDLFSVWSWNGALGFSSAVQSAYYTNSPFLLLLLPFSGYARLAALDLMIFLKLALSAAAFAWYLERKFEKYGFLTAVFGVSYALGAYTLAFISQPMWLDTVLFLPLILYALDRLIQGKSPIPYALLLALAIYSNFYISFALCLFLVLWFLISVIMKEWHGFRDLLKTGVRFAWASVAAGLLCAVTLIPLALHMENWISSSIGFAGEWEWYHGLPEIADSFSAMLKSSLEFGPANVFCGSAMLFLALAFVLNAKIPLRRRLPLAALAVLLFVSFEWNLLDFIWHGLHFPNQLPGRQSFLFIFVILLMGYEALIRYRGLCFSKLLFSFAVSGGFLLLGIGKSQNVQGRLLSVAVIAAVFLTLAILLIAENRARVARLARLAVAVVLLADICANGIFVLCVYGKAANAVTYTQDEAQMIALSEKYGSGKDSFTRMEMAPAFTFNPGQLYGFKGISYYSSTMNGNTYRLMERLGNRVYAQNVSTVYMPTPFQDMMFGVKHYLMKNGKTLSYAKRLEKVQGISVYESPYALPIAYAVAPNIANIGNGTKTGLALQERFIGLAANMKRKLAYESGLVSRTVSNGTMSGAYLVARDVEVPVVYTVELSAQCDGYFFLDFDFTVGTYTVSIDGSEVRTGHCGADPLVDVGYLYAGDRVNVTVTVHGYSYALCGVRGYSLDKEALREAYKKLSAESLQVEYASDTQIRGEITLENDGVLYASIPAERGWSVYIDGKKAEIYDLGLGLTFCDITAGTHTVEYRYRTPGLLLGVLISSATAVAIGFAWFVPRRKKKNV